MSTLSDVRGRPLYLNPLGLDYIRLKAFIEDLTIQEPLLTAVVPIPVMHELQQAQIDAAILEVSGAVNATLSSALYRLYLQPGSALEMVYLKQLIAFAPATFTPTDVAGLILWLDGDDSATLFQDSLFATSAGIGDVVGGWTDKSTAGNDYIQATTANKPLRQTTGIDFDGTDDRQSSSLTSTTKIYSIYLAYDLDDITAALEFIADFGTGRLILVAKGGTGSVLVTYYDTAHHGTNAAIAGSQVVTYLLGSSLGEIRRNGVSLDSGLSWADKDLGGVVKLGSQYQDVAHFGGLIKEYLIYEGLHDTAQAQEIEDYLNTKWSLY